jgi:HAD superfamily 5'-nucleotidase-like hydrolase
VAEQLALPLPDLSTVPRVGIPRAHRVYVNRNLKLTGVDWVGFDMDYTLAVYDQNQMDRLSIEATVAKLIDRGWPEMIRDLTYSTGFPIRGLLIDKRLGHILKMDRYKVVQKGHHGMRPLQRDEIRSLYQAKKIRPATPRYYWIDTLYALSEVAIYAGIVDGMEAQGLPVDYARLFDDIRASIDEAHRDGTIVDRVLSNIQVYVRRDPLLAHTLHKLRSAGKKLFLLTNSQWNYTSELMRHLLGEAMPEYPSWRHYFDIVICAAAKPAFFQERRPLMERELDASRASSGAQLRSANHIERGRVYEGGNLLDFERIVGASGDRILFVGDHIYGDILRSKKESSWRTAMIVQEMEAEVAAHEASADDLHALSEATSRRDQLEDELRAHQTLFKELARQIESAVDTTPPAVMAGLEANRSRVKRAVERVRGWMRAVEAETSEIEARIDRRFHPYWGSLMKESNEMSSFGDQVEAYACVYTSRVSNFLHYSPLQHFRSPRDLMPHEM